MASSDLIEYIQSARQAGMAGAEIAAALEGAGWRLADVIAALTEALARRTEHPEYYEEPAIAVRGVSKNFGKVAALDNVSLTARPGKVLALLGPNGAGKTTLIRILSTLLKPDSGFARIGSFDVAREANQVRNAIGYAGQFAAIDEILTGRENLELVGRLYHLPKIQAGQRASELLIEFDLVDAADRPVKTYSGGMRKRLDLAASLVNNPPILFLDEPTTGLDPKSRLGLWRAVKNLASRGTTVLLTTQYMEEAEHLADWIVVLNHGRVITEGTAGDLKTQAGGNILEVHLADHNDTLLAAERLAQLAHPNFAEQNLGGLSNNYPRVDGETGIVSLPVADGSGALVKAVRILSDADINVADVIFHRPSLNDVFLALTGETAEE